VSRATGMLNLAAAQSCSTRSLSRNESHKRVDTPAMPQGTAGALALTMQTAARRVECSQILQFDQGYANNGPVTADVRSHTSAHKIRSHIALAKNRN
jgi:hypothetical protein